MSNKLFLNRLPLKYAVNVRELGGYPTVNGEATAWNVFLRADNVSQLPEGDMEFLLNYGVNTVVDLRSYNEMEAVPSCFSQQQQVRYAPLPLVDYLPTGKEIRELNPSNFGLKNFYLYILNDNGHNIKKVFEVFGEHKDGVALFHCTAGKDRTGMVAALLLLMAGVPEADIVANYEVSNTYIREIAERVTDGNEANVMGSLADDMRFVLGYIKNQYGGGLEYLNGIGVNDELINVIRSRFIRKK